MVETSETRNVIAETVHVIAETVLVFVELVLENSHLIALVIVVEFSVMTVMPDPTAPNFVDAADAA
jgi:uncharacterized membrane protein